MKGALQAIYRYPVKGFTPEPLSAIELRVGEGLAFDRIFAVEDGRSGFDCDAPAHVAKMRFTVLARRPQIALVQTRFDEATGVLHADAPGVEPIAVRLNEDVGRAVFAAWLTAFLGADLEGPLRAFAPKEHRFFDDPEGDISMINLASVRDLESRIGCALDPRRFRANLYVEGLPAWAEMEFGGREAVIGGARARFAHTIKRCVATHVDPEAGVRDIEVLDVLRREYGHLVCGIYLKIEQPGAARVGDAVEVAA